jgi:hypothetical protein
VLVAHQLLTMAGAQASIRHEPEFEGSEGRRLVVVPSAVSGLATTWRKLLNYVEDGGTLYASLLRGVGGARFPHESGYRARIRNHGHSCFLCEIVIRSQFHTTYEPEA